MKQKYKIAYINKKHVYQERKETTHREIDKNVITTSSNLYLYIYIYKQKPQPGAATLDKKPI